MYCKNCGKQCDDNMSFCDSCGASLRDTQQPTDNGFVQNQYSSPYQVNYQSTSIPGKGLGVASLVLGIISLVLFCVVFISVPFALLAFLFGLIGLIKRKRAGASAGAALGGLVCSCITLAIIFVIVLLASSDPTFLNDIFEGFSEGLYEMQSI